MGNINKVFKERETLNKNIKTKNIIATIQKSTKAAKIEEIGNISRGKYILVRRSLLSCKLCVAKEIEVEKNVQGKRAL